MNQQPIAARQGAGMCQLGFNEIMIVGGFNGKFLPDFYTFKIADNGVLSEGKRGVRNNASQNLFPF